MSISNDTILQLCDEVYHQNRKKWWSYENWWCTGCRKYSKSPTERCFHTADGTNSGCALINHYYANRHGHA